MCPHVGQTRATVALSLVSGVQGSAQRAPGLQRRVAGPGWGKWHP